MGTIGDCGAFSLQAGKTITSGEGGFLATNNKKIYELAKMYHDNGGLRIGCDYPIWENKKTIFGENFKITELQSAIANEQLKKINMILKNQKKNYDYIMNNIDKSFYRVRPCINNSKLVYSNISFEFDTQEECNKFITYMNHYGIGFNIYCSNLINQFDTFKYQNSWHHSKFPYNISHYQQTKCPSAESLFRRVAWFSLSASLKKKHLRYIIQKLEEYQNELQ